MKPSLFHAEAERREVYEERTQKFLEEMRQRNQLSYEGQAVSPAAPFNPKLFKTGMLILFDCFIAAFDLYWILRIFL